MDMHNCIVHVFFGKFCLLTPMVFLKVGTGGDFAGNFPPFCVIIYRERYAFWEGGCLHWISLDMPSLLKCVLGTGWVYCIPTFYLIGWLHYVMHFGIFW